VRTREVSVDCRSSAPSTLILSVRRSQSRTCTHVRTCHHVNANTCSHARVPRRLAITDVQTEPSCVVLSIMSAPPIRSRDDRKRKKPNAPKPISEPIVAPKSSSQPSTAGTSQAGDIRRCGQSCSPYRATLNFRYAPPSLQQSAVRGGVGCMVTTARMWAKRPTLFRAHAARSQPPHAPAPSNTPSTITWYHRRLQCHIPPLSLCYSHFTPPLPPLSGAGEADVEYGAVGEDDPNALILSESRKKKAKQEPPPKKRLSVRPPPTRLLIPQPASLCQTNAVLIVSRSLTTRPMLFSSSPVHSQPGIPLSHHGLSCTLIPQTLKRRRDLSQDSFALTCASVATHEGIGITFSLWPA
jgi:hypothetical protein